jgi:hypothetical protein
MSGITMRGLVLACGVLLLACAREEPSEEQETAAVDEEPATAATISLDDVAGTWSMRATSEAGDTVPSFELVATADQSGWTIHFPNRPPVPVRIVTVAGDSIIAEAGPFESVIRPGVQVSTHYVYRLQDDKLVGSGVARYQTTEPDSVLRIRSEGTRAP